MKKQTPNIVNTMYVAAGTTTNPTHMTLPLERIVATLYQGEAIFWEFDAFFIEGGKMVKYRVSVRKDYV